VNRLLDAHVHDGLDRAVRHHFRVDAGHVADGHVVDAYRGHRHEVLHVVEDRGHVVDRPVAAAAREWQRVRALEAATGEDGDERDRGENASDHGRTANRSASVRACVRVADPAHNAVFSGAGA